MAPNTSGMEHLEPTEDTMEKLVAPQAAPRRYEIVYKNLVTFGYGHFCLVYGIYLAFTRACWATLLFNYVIHVLAAIGVTAGTHRLWAHKSYKVKMPLEIILLIITTLAFQNTIVDWVRDHKMHHRYTDTDGDPHNATRGFFYSHMGWLLVKKHKEVKRRGKFIDMSDVLANPVLRFQKKYAIPFVGTVTFLLPTLIPVFFWNESLSVAWHIAVARYITNLHSTFLVNSLAHIWGYKPYDRNIGPVQNHFVSFTTFGEGFHNYHHVYPWDYRTAELGNNRLNMTTLFIDFFAWIGWAYDLKTVPEEVAKRRSERTGDGTDLWGNKKKDMLRED